VRKNPPLDREHVAADPIEQFGAWFADAERAAPLPEAMTVATVDADGAPNARMVLLKGFGQDGFRFFTNYESVKGTELAAESRAALVIYWRELDRQVRIRGAVDQLPAADSDAYFASRASRQPDRGVDLSAEPPDRAGRPRAPVQRAHSEARRW